MASRRAPGLTTHCWAVLGASHTSHSSLQVFNGIDILVIMLAGWLATAVAPAGIPHCFVCDQQRSACEMPACTWSIDEAESTSELFLGCLCHYHRRVCIPGKCTQLGVTRHHSPVTPICSLILSCLLVSTLGLSPHFAPDARKSVWCGIVSHILFLWALVVGCWCRCLRPVCIYRPELPTHCLLK